MWVYLLETLLLLVMSCVRSHLICENTICAIGEWCDPKRGICRRIWQPSDISEDACNNVHCSDGTTCDSNSGLCIPLSSMDVSVADSCEGVLCAKGEGCDWNTGRCVRFRKPFRRNVKNCSDVLCPQNTKCDPNSGVCRQIVPLLAHIQLTEQLSCKGVICPNGFVCDPNDGVCYRSSRLPSSKCRDIRCPAGQSCNEITGECKQQMEVTIVMQETSSTSASESGQKNACSNVVCEAEMRCEPSTGICKRQDSTITLPLNLCLFVECPNGFECNPSNGSCRRTRHWRRVLTHPVPCGANSHYVECGSACPFTCSDLHRTCSRTCVHTCQCDDTYVQVSMTNITCVPATQCNTIARGMCTNLRCPSGTVCVDGYCNPVKCPKITKPSLPKGCSYDLNRDDRNCLVFDIVC